MFQSRPGRRGGTARHAPSRPAPAPGAEPPRRARRHLQRRAARREAEAGTARARLLRLHMRVLGTLAAVLALALVVGAIVSSGPTALIFRSWVAIGLVGGCHVLALVLTRRPRLPDPDDDGVVVLRSPAALQAGYTVVWLLLTGSTVGGFLLVGSQGAQTPRADAKLVLYLVLASGVALYYLVMLLLGRRHLPSFTMTAEGFTHQGFAKAVTEPWTAVHSAEASRGVVTLDLKGARPDVVVTTLSLRVRPQPLADEINARAWR